MNPNIEEQEWYGEVELRGEDLLDFDAFVKIIYAKDFGKVYRGGFRVTTTLPKAGPGACVPVEVDITHLVPESVIDLIMEAHVVS